MLFCDYYDDWIKTYKEGAVREVTLNKYLMTAKRLREIIPDLDIRDLDRRTYQHILNEYALTHEKQTTSDFHHQVKACVKDLFHDGLLDRDPTYRAIVKGREPGPKKPKYLQTEELKALMKTLDLSYGRSTDWFVCIISKTGIRYAEALGLTPGDFDFDNATLTINKSWNYKSIEGGFQRTKTNASERKISIDWQIIGQFKPLIWDLPVDEPIFVKKFDDGTYERIFNSTINKFMKRKCEQAGVPEISLHSLRHTHASVLLAAGVSIHAISERLGHSNVGVTQETYAHVLNELKAADESKVMSTLMLLT